MHLLNDLAFGLLFVLGTTAISGVAYFLARRAAGQGPHDRHRDAASAMITRIAALHGLILALVFAQEMASYQRIQGDTAAEASAVADVYNDAARYGDAARAPLQAAMSSYVQLVVSKEWQALGQGKPLDPEAWAAWERAYDAALDLVPASPREASLRDHMLDSLHAIASARDVRESEASNSVAGFFWIAALTGVILIAAGHYVYAPERPNLMMLALFSAYTGAILFLIYGFSNPYSPPAELAPTPLIDLMAALAAAPA